MPDDELYTASRSAAMKWLARGSSARRRCVMSPMDEMTWFQSPRFTTGVIDTSTVNQQLFLRADPMRVGVVFTVTDMYVANVGNKQIPCYAIVAPKFQDTVTGIPCGWRLEPYNTTVEIHERDWPGIVQGEWWTYGVFTGTIGTNFEITALELLLRDWPKQ